MSLNMLCPYCAVRNADSRDHVFPDFLGGKSWIPACKECNSTFGHTVEAAALSHLKNLMFFFRRSGMQPPRAMVWKGIGLGPSGERYDVDQDLNAIPSKPILERDEVGRIKTARGSRRQVHQIQKSLETDGRAFRVLDVSPVKIDMRQLRIVYPVDDNTKRLCLKMTVAASVLNGVALSLDERARSYLVKAETLDPCPVRIATEHYAQLDEKRPLVGHLIYAQATPKERRIYAIVQFFSAIQFYCELASDYHGLEKAILATHDPITHKESFELAAPLNYPLPPRHLESVTFQNRFQERLERLRLELVSLYGDQAPLSFKLND